jgi:hypothetical protein
MWPIETSQTKRSSLSSNPRTAEERRRLARDPRQEGRNLALSCGVFRKMRTHNLIVTKARLHPITPFIDNLTLMQAPVRDVTTNLSMYSTGCSMHAHVCKMPPRGSGCPARTLDRPRRLKRGAR